MRTYLVENRHGRQSFCWAFNYRRTRGAILATFANRADVTRYLNARAVMLDATTIVLDEYRRTLMDGAA